MTLLDDLRDQGFISSLDLHFARLMGRLSTQANPELLLAAALVSKWRGRGHSCLPLADLAGTTLDLTSPEIPAITCPPLQAWRQILRESATVGRPGDYRPLILDDHNRLYLHRYWLYEQQLARSISKRLTPIVPQTTQLQTIRDCLARLFTSPAETGPDWQRLAALIPVFKRFCVISGGPGTGKTYTVTKLLALLLELDPHTRIGLAAPTGKAAARLQESIRKEKASLAVSSTIRDAIPEFTATMHRFLGVRRRGAGFHHDRNNPLPYDVVVVDEASMVDLALMTKLIEAVPEKARLILLGDKNQLASVEAGAVLGDICGDEEETVFSGEFAATLSMADTPSLPLKNIRAEMKPGLTDGIILLKTSRRFTQQSSIRHLVEAVNAGNGEKALSILQQPAHADTVRHPLPPAGQLTDLLQEHVISGFSPFLAKQQPAEALAAFARFRILCALRHGPHGVHTLNRTVETILQRAGLISIAAPWYHGRPVMVTENDYGLQLFNGDVGIAMADPDDETTIRVYFPTADGTGIRSVLPGRLPETETVFAMTIHKSQGSEFERLLMILPDKPSPVLTRELIYTGISRARTSLELWLTEEIFLQAVATRTRRISGLRDLLTETGL